jgi:hypothetical protein
MKSVTIAEPEAKARSKSEAKKRDKPFIPRLNLNQDYLELKCQERDMQELRQQELRAKLPFDDSDREVHDLSLHQDFLQSEINEDDFIQQNHHNE